MFRNQIVYYLPKKSWLNNGILNVLYLCTNGNSILSSVKLNSIGLKNEIIKIKVILEIPIRLSQWVYWVL